ncbi:MAG: DNA oxidative demethylase AlkB [Gammaproteobacteria bacterium]
MTHDLFAALEPAASCLPICPGAVVLRDFVGPRSAAILTALEAIEAAAPFRHMVTPGGRQMSVAMTNCGHRGWGSDRRGYRYEPCDPVSGQPWPGMPGVFLELARAAADAAGFAAFVPDACLVNRYVPGTRLSLHQDRDERDFSAPIVSVSLGLPAVFQFGGPRRADRCVRIPLAHGDIVVWGGPARRHYHGVLPLADGVHPATGRTRLNLTMRKAG